ncbi:MAG: C13 family peptidase [Thermodesulfobacteriota bacterium]|nr:C13 family peptidase [Thermodesulfobacteriota bacterium]
MRECKPNLFIGIVILLCLSSSLFSPRMCSAQIDTFDYAYDKLIADVFGGGRPSKEIFGRPDMVTGSVAVKTARGIVELGTGPGWVFFIKDDSIGKPINELVLVKTSGNIVRTQIKVEPLSLADFLPIEQQRDNIPTAAATITTLEDACSRLIHGLLGHTVGNRRIYTRPEKVRGRVTVENWKGILFIGQGPGWLFFVDDNPAANWEHACRFVLVTGSGEILAVKSTTPPKDMTPFKRLTSPQQTVQETFDDPHKPGKGTRKEPKVSKFLGESNTPAANRWAVIISGGYNQGNNHIRYWNDCSYFYHTLMANGFLDDHIYVLISDGTDPAVDRSDDSNSPTDLDDDGDDDTQYSAIKTDITTVFNILQGQLDADDILFIFTTDHGGSNDDYPYDDPDSILYLWNTESITDVEFATEVNKVTTKATICIFEQCYSGGMIDDLKGENRVLMSASRFWELSYSMGSFIYDEFSYYLTYALAHPPDADANSDGVVSMEEGYLYALANDSCQSELIDSYGNNEGEHPSYYSNPWDLGRKISLAGYCESVESPVMAGYSQCQVTESFPSGGVNQGWYGDDEYWTYTLSFHFPYNGRAYSQIYIGSNGVLYFSNPDDSPKNNINGLKSENAVAPLWDDLTIFSADGDAIYIIEDTYSVTIRWQAHTYQDSRPVNVAAKLSSSGDIRFLYGSGNDHSSRINERDKTIGISIGDDWNYHLCLRNGEPHLGNAQAIEYCPYSSAGNSKWLPAVLHLLLGD